MINISWDPYGEENKQKIIKTSSPSNSIAFLVKFSLKMHILQIDICADYDYFSDMIYNPMKILPTKSIKFKKEGKDP